MEVSGPELKKNERCCAIKFCHCLYKTFSEIVKEAYKDNWIDESTNFRWYSDLKKEHLSAELALKPGRPESTVDYRNTNGVWANLARISPNEMWGDNGIN